MTFIGNLGHGAHTLVVHRRGRDIHWQTWTPDRQPARHGTPAQAEDAIRDWIASVTDDWTEQAELRRRALPIRYRIDHKEGSSHENQID